MRGRAGPKPGMTTVLRGRTLPGFVLHVFGLAA